MRYSIPLVTVAAAAALVAVPARGGSIWARAHHHDRAVYADDVARDVGDIVTVVVNEQSSVSSDTTRELSKSDSRSAKLKADMGLVNGLDQVTGRIFNLDDLDMSADSATSFDGESEFGADSSVVDRMTVVVEDVLPNGNLVILGKRQREVHGEKQTIQLSGILRPSDINFDNLIPSDRVANFHIVVHSTGRQKRFTNPGWLGQILNFLNPF